MTPRPVRLRIHDSLGRIRTLSDGPGAYERLTEGDTLPLESPKTILLLGTGPHPEQAIPPAMSSGPEGYAVFWLESPSFLAALRDEGCPVALPEHWQRIDPAQAGTQLPALIREKHPLILTYRQSRRLFPEFWGPLLAVCRMEGEAPGTAISPADVSAVILPGGAKDLLHRDLEQALKQEGFSLLPFPVSKTSAEVSRTLPDLRGLLALLRTRRPALFLSVNLRGLDAEGHAFHLLRAAGIPVCLWFVDNPWQILSSLRLPWWKEAIVLTTDATFLPELRACGAKYAEYMPLAASSFFLSPPPVLLPQGTRVLFVGRTSFPGKSAFFSAASCHPEWEAEARGMLRGGERPGYHWWKRRIEEERGQTLPSWPGHAAREAGQGAEELALYNRIMWLEEAASLGQHDAPALTLVGDEGWKNSLSVPACFLPPVDYYGTLPGLYRAAPFTLDVTSLLLPGGLTQRHFDVWRAGGFLLSATGTGITLFPSELAAPISLRRPGDLVSRVKYLECFPAYKEELRAAWQREIEQKHLYRHRIQSILKLAKMLDGSLPCM